MKRLLFLILLLPCLVYGQTVGIKVASPIIKNSPSDNTVTGYADLLNGGYHIVTSLAGRDSLNTAYSKTLKVNMLCYVGGGVDSTYRWSGTVWNPVASGGISLSQLTDSLQNYTPLQDGLISGGNATIGTGSVTIDTAYYRINKENKMSLPRTFTGISNSASGTQYYILVYGKTDNTLDTLQGVQDTIATVPTKPDGTVSINTVLVGDGGIEQAIPDLSGYFKINDVNNGLLDINVNYGDNISLTKTSNYRPSVKFIGQNNSSSIEGGNNLYFYTDSINRLIIDSIGNTGFGKFPNYKVDVDGDVNINSRYLINGSKITASDVDTTSIGLQPKIPYTPYDPASYPVNIGGETLQSVTDRGNSTTNNIAIGGTTPLSTLHLKNPSYNLFRITRGTVSDYGFELGGAGEFYLKNYMSGNYPITINSSDAITFTSSITAQSFIKSGATSSQFLMGDGSSASFGAIGSTPNANGASISGGTITLQPASSTYGGLVSATTQSFVGDKTFNGSVGFGTTASTSSYFNTSAGTTSKSSLRIPNGVAPTTPVSGDWWSLTTGLRTQTYDGTQTKDFIFDKANNVFASGVTSSIVANASGDLTTVPLVNYLTRNNLTKSSAYTITTTDFGANGFLTIWVSGNTTITLPSASQMAGITIDIVKTDVAGTTVTLSTGGTITAQGGKIQVQSDGTTRYEF